MNHYEPSTIVSGQGDIHLAGIPFTPGTEVEVVVSSKPVSPPEGNRVTALLAALDQAHNTQPIRPLRRDELYDRNGVH
jgi:hypothetical protein